MNTRSAIQPSTDPLILAVSYSHSRKRFIASLSDGIRIFRTDNCLTTYQPKFGTPADVDPVIDIAQILDDRYIAYVPRKNAGAVGGNVVIFYDCLHGKEVCKFDFYEPVLGIRLSRKWMVVVLQERTVIFQYQELQKPTPVTEDSGEAETARQSTDDHRGPNQVHALYPTSPNIYGLATLQDDFLVLPAQSTGQAQLIPLEGGNKRVVRAHSSGIRQLSLSPDSTLLATASEQGTLIRVFNTKSTDQIAEFRRGVEKAIVFSIAFSPGNRWLASTSDKGTLHVFDLHPQAAITTEPSNPSPPSRTSTAQPRRQPNPSTHRLSAGATSEKDSLSAFSGRSSAASTAIPAYQGSVQEYYGLRPPPASATAAGRETAVSAISAFKASSWAPKVLKDVRSVASAPFWTGDEGPYWQQGGHGKGGTHRWTTTPTGMRKRVKNPVLPLANDPTGRPPKGLIAFAPSESGVSKEDTEVEGAAVLYVVGGGAEGRWEMFDLVPVPLPPGGGGSGWALVRRGFRKFLKRQFVD